MFLIVFLCSFVVFLIVDLIVISLVIKPIFMKHVGAIVLEQPNLLAAGLFYVMFCAGLVHLVSMPYLMGSQAYSTSIMNASIIGVMSYACYELTNKALIQNWSWQLVIIDTIWGGLLSAITVSLGLLIYKYIFA